MTSYRSKFIIPDGIYLASHSVGPMTRLGQEMLEHRFTQPWQLKGAEAWADWLDLIDAFCQALGTLLQGKAVDFCPQANLSSGLTKYLTSLPDPKQRYKILMHADAFPSMGFVIDALKPRGYQLDLIPSQLPSQDVNIWAEAIDDRTACVLITHVHSNTGALSPVRDIVSLCRQNDIRSVVDVAQSVGIIPINLENWNADIVLGSCVKWLCGGPGAGFMWVNPDHIDDLAPEDVGWFSHENPFEFNIRDFRYAKTAKRFWGGTPNIAPYAIALGGIKTITEIGIENIRKHNVDLMKTVTPDIDPAIHGGTLCLNVTNDIASKLSDAGCHFDRRGAIARLSFHIFNEREEAKLLADLLK